MSTTFKYYGISFFEIETQGCKILVDPCISTNRLCPVRVEDVTEADLILVTHGAADHMGDAIEIQKRTGAILISDPAVRLHALRHEVKEDKVISGLWGDVIEIGGIKIQIVECRHISFFKSGDMYISGLPLSFVIYADERTRIYNVGDSALFSDMKLIAELYRPNVALVPVGGQPELTGGFAHLAPREAALCVQWVGPEVVIPTHFDPKGAEANEFTTLVGALAPTVKPVVLEPGKAFTYNPQEY